jgi:4-amino-4-deoxy-L-arabinose transferase-like glycosyltransferase
VNQTLLRYLEAHQGTTRYLFATSNANSASGYIIQTGKPVMALGGFLGSDPILTPTTLAQLVANGTVRYFLLPSAQGFRMPSGMLQDVPSSVRNQIEAFGRGGSGGFGPGGQASALTQWVSTNCATVPSSLWQTTSSNQSGASAGGPGFGPDNGGQQLYDCASRPSK